MNLVYAWKNEWIEASHSLNKKSPSATLGLWPWNLELSEQYPPSSDASWKLDAVKEDTAILWTGWVPSAEQVWVQNDILTKRVREEEEDKHTHIPSTWPGSFLDLKFPISHICDQMSHWTIRKKIQKHMTEIQMTGFSYEWFSYS